MTTPEKFSRTTLPIPDQPFVGLTTYDAKDPNTAFPPIEAVRPPPGAPNVLIVMIDDCGFGAAGRRQGADSVGNFVELKKTVLGDGSKANHLAYIGDTTMGAGVNFGAGSITANYDGVNKHTTVIEDGAFIGSDSQLVAPVTVGKNSYVTVPFQFRARP